MIIPIGNAEKVLKDAGFGFKPRIKVPKLGFMIQHSHVNDLQQ